jgi:hypothetical protein
MKPMKRTRIVLSTILLLLFTATAQAQIDSTSPHEALPEHDAALPAQLLPATPNAYLRGTCSLWGQHSKNTDAMTAAFGADWNTALYNAGSGVFNPDVCFIYMEGGDDCAIEMNTYLNTHRATIENWVANGGSLFINAAPNVGGDIDYGFGGVTMHSYQASGNLIPNVAASNALHPVFAGPYPTQTTFSGTWYTHGYMTGPGASIIVNSDGSGQIAFSEQSSGIGNVMFGSMTTTNFHSPQPAADNLRANMFDYGGQQCVTPIEVAIDIKFCSNPNAHNCRSGGVLPVTIFGAADLDVANIDLASLQLCRADGGGCTPLGSAIDSKPPADRGGPGDRGTSECVRIDTDGDGVPDLDVLNPDGFDDLDAGFDKSAVSDLLDVCAVGSKGDSSVALFIQGSLLDGTPIFSTPVGTDGIDQLVRKNR